MKLYKYFILAAAIVMSAAASAQVSKKDAKQAKYNVSGKIVDADNGQVMELVNVVFDNNSFWAISDLNGKFSLQLADGEYHYEVSYVGYETSKGTIKVAGKDLTGINIRLKPSSLSLAEVVVTAKQQSMGSSSVIDKTALQHLQPKSVEEMLQLVPGSITSNPDMNSIGQASIREIGGDLNNSIGASIVLDGAPISNDATVMSLSTSKSGNSDTSGQSTTGKGTDLRTISPDNVESVEVIRGIPSVEYGNLTSGAVIIKTKKGSTPLEVKGKADPNSKMAYIGKGFTLGTGTTVNLGFDYTSSYEDIRFKAEGYERVTGDIGLSQTFFSNRPLSVNLKLAYFNNLNTVRRDPQQQDNEESKSDNKGIRLSLNGDWNVKTAVVSNISYNFSVNSSHQRDTNKEFKILSAGMQPVGSSLEEGEHVASYLDGNYYSEYYIDGKPLDIFAQIKGTKNIFFRDDFTSAFKAGLEFSYDVNKGEGLVFDPAKPPVVNEIQTVRPRAYTDIPAMKTMSAFIENKTIAPVGTTVLTAQLGVRASELFINRDYLDADNIFTFDPRANVEWNILNSKNNGFFDKLAVNGGWGITSKMPSLSYLYPDKAYFDQLSYNHMNPHFAVTSTKIIDNTGNVNIKPSIGRKAELGFSFKLGKISGMCTFFYEKYKNEFGYSSNVMTQTFNVYHYSLPSNATSINSFVSGSGEINCTYTEEGQEKSIDMSPTSIAQDSLFITYRTPQNHRATTKKGIEYSINFGQLDALRTSLVVDGAWLWVNHYDAGNSWSTLNNINGDYYPYAIIYPAGDGSISERINTNFRFITHIPEVKMVFTTTAQVVWKEVEQETWIDSNGNNVWYRSNLYTGGECLAIDPVGYVDYAGNYYEWDEKYRNRSYKNKEYEMIVQRSQLHYYDREEIPGHVIFNFRLTKEFGDMFEVSFMANNMLNTRKIYRSEYTGGRTSLAIDQYFGAEIKLKL